MKPTGCLFPFSLPYHVAVQFRNRFYDKGILRQFEVNAPVISVGNLSVGGTGKTPFVIHLVEMLRIIPVFGGKKAAVVSRGYRGKYRDTFVVSDGRKVIGTPEYAGDEAVMIAEALPGTAVVVDKDRLRGAEHAVEQLRARVVVLDDGFQHRKLARDLDIVLLDATDPLGNRLVLPGGVLREPASSLNRADIVVLSKAKGEDDELAERAKLLSDLIRKPVVVTRLVPKFWRKIGGGELLAAGEVRGKRVLSFAGIANPQSFTDTIAGLEGEIVKSIRLPDHSDYKKSTIEYIARSYVLNKAEWMVTTSKDAVKLPLILRHLPVYYLEIGLEVVVGGDILGEVVRAALDGRKRNALKEGPG